MPAFIYHTGSERNSGLYILISIGNYLVGDVKTHCDN